MPMPTPKSAMDRKMTQTAKAWLITVKPTAHPDLKLKATVADVETVPFTAGKYAVRLRVNPGDGETIMPGMACTAKFTPYVDERALTVPAKSVFTDELDERKQHVYLVSEDGKHKKRRVTVGRKSGDKLEILKGLSEGDQIVIPQKTGTTTTQQSSQPRGLFMGR